MPIVTDYTALLSGSSWNGIEVSGRPAIVTYSFPTAAAGYLADVDGFTPATIASFQAFTAAEQSQVRAALAEWAGASGLVFLEVAPGQGDLNFQLVDFDTTSGPSYAGAGGVAFYPFGGWDYFSYPSFSSDLDASGDVFMNSRFAGGGSVVYGTLLHEIGHALGLKHPTEVVTDYAPYPPVTHDQVLAADDPALTIMAEVGDSGVGEHLKALDQQAAAFLYGPAGAGQVVTASASGANSVSSWSWNAARQILTQTGFAGDDTLRGSSVTDTINGGDGDDRLFALNGNDTLNGGDGDDLLNGGPGNDKMTGGDGNDTYVVGSTRDRTLEQAGQGFDTVLTSVSYTLAANLELLQLFGTSLTGRGNALDNTIYGDGSHGNRLYGLAGNDYLAAGSGNDTLIGDVGIDSLYGGDGKDKLNGGADADWLVGGLGADSLTGGSGGDTFVFDVSDSPSTAAPVAYDIVTDFESGLDRIDLSTVGAGGLSAGAFATATASANSVSSVLAAAAAAMAGGDKSVIFVTSPTYGWLAWNTDGDLHTPEQIVRLNGLAAPGSLQASDVI